VNTPILSSTLLLTLLMAVGLVFFIRASVKDRIQQVGLIAQESEESILKRLQQYFDQRAYHVAALDANKNQVTFQGFVRPSWFMAIFLTTLAACGILCLSLVLSFLYPSLGRLFLGLVLLSPTAGIFYWQKAGRNEQVSLTLKAFGAQEADQTLVTVTAHRDELQELQQALKLKPAIESSSH
jgi:Cofactor assembly of complex C subunit B